MGSQRVGHDWATELNWTENLSWHHATYRIKSKLLSLEYKIFHDLLQPSQSDLSKKAPCVQLHIDTCPQTQSNQTEPLLGPWSPETFIPYIVWVISSWNTVCSILCPPGNMSCQDQIFLFIFFLFGEDCACAGSSLLCRGFLSLQQVGLLSSCGARASCCSAFSYCRAQAPGRAGFTSWSVQAQ